MGRLRNALDRTREGTHYSDRMHRILGVCQDCGLLWHEERVASRSGATEIRRVDDIEPAHSVLVTPQYEKYGLKVNPRVLPRLKKMASQFAYALNVPSVSVEVDGNIVYVRVPLPHRGETSLVTYEQAWAIAPDIAPGNVLLGVDEEHHQLVLELIAPTNVHAAVIGMTGSGKSTLMSTMIISALMIGNASVALFDPSDGFRPLSGHPAVWRGGLFRTPEECEAGLGALAQSIGRNHRGTTYAFVDEVPDLVMQRPAIKDHLARLAQSGRHAGIHLVIGAQHLLASTVGSMTMRNIPVRLVGRVSDRTAAYNASGRSDTGAEYLRGRGDFIVANGSTLRHFQAAYVSKELLDRWLRRYPPRSPRVPIRPDWSSVVRPSVCATSDGQPGRPPDDIPLSVVSEIRRYVRRHGAEPSSNWVYRLTKRTMPTGGFNRDKVRRAISAAMDSSVGP